MWTDGAQCRAFRPKLAVMATPELAGHGPIGAQRLGNLPVEVRSGKEGLLAAATMEEADTVITAVVGMVGLEPTLAAIQRGKRIGLANKETLVCAGELVMEAADRYGAEIIPVDSEHSAIFQCLAGCRDRGQGPALDPYLLRWPLLRQKAGGTPVCDPGGRPVPSQLAHGCQDYHRLRHPDEQGTGAH